MEATAMIAELADKARLAARTIIRQMLMMQAIQRIANNSPTGSIH